MYSCPRRKYTYTACVPALQIPSIAGHCSLVASLTLMRGVVGGHVDFRWVEMGRCILDVDGTWVEVAVRTGQGMMRKCPPLGPQGKQYKFHFGCARAVTRDASPDSVTRDRVQNPALGDSECLREQVGSALSSCLVAILRPPVSSV